MVILSIDSGNIYVPSGASVWEMSTERDYRGKAERDYFKRSTDSLGVDKQKTSILLVTCRKWTNSNEWVTEKKLDNKWADVRVLDADDLVSWLMLCPSVHRWLAVLMGKLPNAALTIEQAWGLWSFHTNPPTNPELSIAGRLNEEQRLIELLEKSPSSITIASDWGEDAYSFVLSVVSKRAKLSSRLLVVKDEKEWNSLIETHWSLILIPHIENLTGIGYAVSKGHWVVLPVTTAKLTNTPQIPLNKPDQSEQIKRLVLMGVEKKKAST